MCHWKEQLKSVVRGDQRAFEKLVQAAMHLAWCEGRDSVALEWAERLGSDVETHEVVNELKLKSPYKEEK